MYKKLGVVVCLIYSIFLVILIGCSQDDGDNGNGNGEGPTEEQLDEVEGYMTKQADYYADYEALLGEMDTASALDSLVSILSNDPDVETVVNVGLGANITWTSGLRGGIVTRFKKENPGESARSFGKPRSTSSAKIESGFRAPQANKSIFLAPCNAQFAMWDMIVTRDSKTALTSAGYDSFTIYREEECTVDRICGLTGGSYGIIRISSHGIPWSSETDVQEVYLVTGEAASRTSIESKWQFLDNYFLIICHVNGANRYCMESAYFAMFNDFGNDRPFVSLGFCYSGLGHWPTDVMNTCHAGAVMGWDWSIYSNSDCGFVVDFINDMCDDSRETPLTVQEWLATNSTSIWDHSDGKYINMVFNAVDSFVLALPFKVTAVFPPAGINTYGGVIGKGFGDEQGSSKVMFGEVEVDISWWRDDTIIVYIRSDDLPHGEVPVKVVVAGLESNSVPFYNGIDVSLLHSFEFNLFINTNYTTPYGSYEDYWNFEAPQHCEVLGNFEGQTMDIVVDTISSGGEATEILDISITVDDPTRMITDLSITQEIEWTSGYSSFFTITAENIPVIYFGGNVYDDPPLLTLQATIEGVGTCPHITDFEYQQFDSLGNPTHSVTSFDCDTSHTGYITELEIFLRNRTIW